MSDSDLLTAIVLAMVSSGTAYHPDTVIVESRRVFDALKKELDTL